MNKDAFKELDKKVVRLGELQAENDKLAERVKALEYGLRKLYEDSTAWDFNEHWESYELAESLLKKGKE